MSIVACAGDIRQAIDADRTNSALVDPVKHMVREQIPDYRSAVAVVDSIHLHRFTLGFWYPYRYTAMLHRPRGAAIGRGEIPAGTDFVVACDVYQIDLPVKEMARSGTAAVYAVTGE
jgi:hypothetical protein